MNRQPSRFGCPSYALTLGHLFRKARLVLALCLAIASLMHLSLGGMVSGPKARTVAKPLTTQFVKRQPRLTKPLELKKKPRPKRRTLQRKMVSVKARVDRGKTGGQVISTVGLVGKLTQPKISVSRITGFQEAMFEPQAAAAIIESSQEPGNKVDMSLEMLDVNALDTGRYHAMVIQDPNDKRNIRGYFHFVQAYPVSVVAARRRMNEFPKALRNLVEKLNAWTDIKADVIRNVPFSSEEIFKVPFIYFDYGDQGFTQRLSLSEALSLGQYMLRGGLYMAEDGWPGIGSVFDRAARATIEDALAAIDKPKGKHWEYEKIPNDHAIYHCYYDFQGGPPTGGTSRLAV